LLPAAPREGVLWLAFHLSLAIALWLVGAIWIVASVVYFFDVLSDIVWFVLFSGTGAALRAGLKNLDRAISGVSA
jgi:hypothetical protein